MDLKNIIIFLVVFFIVLWLQHNDDSKNNVKRVSLYDNIKIPLIATLLAILIKNIDYTECVNTFQSILIFNKVETPIEMNQITDQSTVLNDIFTGPPDF
jgi:predicted permease